MPTSRGRSTTSQPSTLNAFIDAAADAVARTIAGLQRDAQREREIRDAEHRARTAELTAAIASVAEMERRIAERLASLKDGEPGRGVTLDELRPLVASSVAEAVKALPAAEPGKPGVGLAAAMIDRDGELVVTLSDGSSRTLGPVVGKSVSEADIEGMIEAAASKAVAALNLRNGEDADPDAIAAVVRAEVAKATDTIPQLIAAAVDELPKPEPGKSVTAEDVRPMLDEMVAALPPAEPGKSVDPAVVEEMVAEKVAAAMDALPKPKDGAPGKLPLAKPWADKIHYEGAVVTDEGATWQALKDTARKPPHEDWICLAAAGKDGENGRSFTIRGTWTDKGKYAFLDVVALDGGAFAARRDNPGQCPGEGWQMIASRGKPGRPGERSTVKGPPGPPAVAMSIDHEGLLTLTNADGSVVTCDLYPLLSKLG